MHSDGVSGALSYRRGVGASGAGEAAEDALRRAKLPMPRRLPEGARKFMA